MKSLERGIVEFRGIFEYKQKEMEVEKLPTSYIIN